MQDAPCRFSPSFMASEHSATALPVASGAKRLMTSLRSLSVEPVATRILAPPMSAPRRWWSSARVIGW